MCIPRTLANTTWRDVRDIFEGVLGRGCVDRIDMVNKVNHRGESYQCAFIHLHEWPDNEHAMNVRTRLLEGNDIKLVYDDPWFWKCSVSRLTKPVRRSYVPPRETKMRDRLNTRARDLKYAERKPCM